MTETSASNILSISVTQEWSSPERRQGHQQLNLIPNEIYHEILSNIDEQNDLPSAALTCRFFASVIIPQTFRVISIHTADNGELTTWPRLLKLIQETSNPRAASFFSHVRQVTIRLPYSPPSMHTSVLRFSEDILLKSPNVEQLIVFDIQLPNMIRTISGLSKLSSLELHLHDDSQDITDAEITSCVFSLRLESFELYLSPEMQDRYPHLAGRFIPFALSPHLRKFGTDSWEMVCGFASQTTLPPLQEVTLWEVEDSLFLYRLLCRIPTLVNLELTGVSLVKFQQDPTGAGRAGLPLSSLPNLRRLVIPPHFVSLLTGPHSLREIQFTEETDPDARFEFPFWSPDLDADMKLLFSSPCPDVERLEFLFCVTVSPGRTWYKNMGQWFPKLRRLSFELLLDFSEGEDYVDFATQIKNVFESFLNTWGPLRTLHKLDFIFNRTLEEEYLVDGAWIESVLPKYNFRNYFPNLTEIGFGRYRRTIAV
ncbi:hypothetical protein GYMLUDRAFT_99615 [Collybiopsis luxurians FD-317 M1]|uniref:F-box domain-containing protein n=1 Tax=Collybiopsis luxurians FD-317 M1 TaxID=944289 RepID=A0A0D0BZK9_9AGAR|nr:hypothetical protein GYMLUDRAFT_99615 [Collybiopsis luxurians FD-317 M1]